MDILRQKDMDNLVRLKFYTIKREGKRILAYPNRKYCQDTAPIFVQVGEKWVPLGSEEADNGNR